MIQEFIHGSVREILSAPFEKGGGFRIGFNTHTEMIPWAFFLQERFAGGF
jgi:hypothetical protein